MAIDTTTPVSHVTYNGQQLPMYVPPAPDVPEVKLQSKTVDPGTAAKDITADSGFDGLSSVHINAIQTETINITSNGTYVPTGSKFFSSVKVDIQTEGHTPNFQAKTVVPSESPQKVIADNGFDALKSVSVEAISATYVGSGIPNRSSSDLATISGTVLVPAGYYETQAQKTVDIGTAGTPTASKGAVANHSVTITPTVTNVGGYINSGTLEGSGVTVTASELVSGELPITQNGSVNVTNYATVNVNIPFVTYYTGSSAPASSLGSNGDIYLQM